MSALLCLSACGGGGSSGGAQTQSSGDTVNMDGRYSYTWEFEDTSGPAMHQYFPSKDGAIQTLGAMTTCANEVVNCQVDQRAVASGKSGRGLRFLTSSSASFAWIKGGNATTICSSDLVQFDPFGSTAGREADVRMTIAMWINPEKIEADQTYHLFGTGDPMVLSGSIYKAASFHLRMVGGKLKLSLYPTAYSANPDMVLESTSTLAMNSGGSNWHHVAVTYDNFKTVMYLDGRVDASATRNAANRNIKEVCRPYYLGGMSISGFPGAPAETNSYIFPGSIDQLVFSNRAYSANEILSLAGGLVAK